jgi:hypothetical protein
MLTKAEILATPDLPSEEVNVPEWGGTVYVKAMNGTERDCWEQAMIDAKKEGKKLNVRAELAVRVVCDQQNVRLFADEDADTLGTKSGKALDRVFDVAQRLCGFGTKDMEELEKN